jgi:hypothetical protein
MQDYSLPRAFAKEFSVAAQNYTISTSYMTTTAINKGKKLKNRDLLSKNLVLDLYGCLIFQAWEFSPGKEMQMWLSMKLSSSSESSPASAFLLSFSITQNLSTKS